MKKEMIGSLFAMIVIGAAAPDPAYARAAYQERQALAEVPRLVQQFDQLAANQDEIVQRLLKVESGSSTEAALRAEIEALRPEEEAFPKNQKTLEELGKEEGRLSDRLIIR